MNSMPGPRSVNRLIEWYFSAVIIGFAAITAFTYGEPQSGAFLILSNSGFGDAWVILIFGFLGIVRLASLYANGHWQPYGAWMRTAASLCGALIWGVLLAALALIYFTQGTLYRGATVIYVFATIFELLSVHRAANDSRIGRL